MESLIIIAALILVPLIVFQLRKAVRNGRHSKWAAEPLPQEWIDQLNEKLPPYPHMPTELQNQLHGYIQIFIHEKKFEGCGGQEITERIKLAVAAQACLLLVGRPSKVYPKLKTVLIYPHTYQGGQKGMFGGDNGDSARLGESWDCGVVVLSWNSVKGGITNYNDGHNVTFHEFAHQLDQESGAADGAPVLDDAAAYATWSRVLSQDYEELVDKTNRGKKDTIDSYGATDPAEFFAVSTETFFEKPRQLQDKHPELYEKLKMYYKVDPLEWLE